MTEAQGNPRPPLRFRWVKPDELGEVMEIDRLTWHRPLPEREWRKALLARRVTCAVAVLDGRIVGYMAYKDFRDFLHLYKIAVRPEFQGRGIGRALVRRLKMTLMRRGREHIQINVRRDDLRARRFWRRNGFASLGVAAGYYAPGEDAIQMIFESPVARPGSAPEGRP
jgi:ribosomal-protein-alanine N-acetyltransferase